MSYSLFMDKEMNLMFFIYVGNLTYTVIPKGSVAPCGGKYMYTRLTAPWLSCLFLASVAVTRGAIGE